VDTREKIVPLGELATHLTAGEWLAVAGLFDPLTAVQAKRLAGLANSGRRLMAVVLSDSETLLAADARAALIASLRSVDLVAVARAGEWRSAIPQGTDLEIVEDLAAESGRSAEFVRFVLQRQASADQNRS